MNKKGFTLIELLAVIVILALISLIAIPNITSVIENNKKELMVTDAIHLISLARYEIEANPSYRAKSEYIMYMKSLNALGQIKDENAFGEIYDQDKSYVKYTKKTYTFEVYLATKDGGKHIGTQNSPIESSSLHRSVVE